MYPWNLETAQDVKKIADVREATELQFYKNKYLKILNMKYQLKDLGEQMAKVKDKEEELKIKLKEKTAREHNNSHLFITINPKPIKQFGDKPADITIHLEHFVKKVNKFINRNFCDEASAVIEQRGVNETELGQGYHAHIALKRNVMYRPSDIVKGAKNTFKDVCNVKKPELLNIRIHGPDFHKDKMEYIKGIKTGEGKDKKQLMDVLFREKYNIEKVYNAQNVAHEESQ
jgi:hypothetical protein